MDEEEKAPDDAPTQNPKSETQNQADAAAEPYAEWKSALNALAASPGTTLLLGGMDVGKTTFTRLLANRFLEAGCPPALLDADLGQSEIGPPACVGIAFCDAPILALSDLKPHALAFVGSASPPGYLLEHVAGIRRLADMAEGQAFNRGHERLPARRGSAAIKSGDV